MLLFNKKDLLVVLAKDGDTVEFSKPIKDILKYQRRYNYKFKLYETGKVTVADDYIIEDETLTVFFGSAYVEYSSSGATYNDGGGSVGGEGGNVYNVEPIPESEFAEGGAFYNLTIERRTVVSGTYIDASSDLNPGDVIVSEDTVDGLTTIERAIILTKNSYLDIPYIGTVKEVVFDSSKYTDHIQTDTIATTYIGKYFKLEVEGGLG